MSSSEQQGGPGTQAAFTTHMLITLLEPHVTLGVVGHIDFLTDMGVTYSAEYLHGTPILKQLSHHGS